jgi:UDP-glucose 4-epimerase
VHGVPTLGLRFFNVYGPRQDPLSPYSGVISIFAGQAATGQPITIHGDGSQTRDFIFVADVVDHLTAAMRHLHHTTGCSVLNVCTGQGTSVLNLAQILLKTQDRPTTLIRHGADRPGDIRHSVGNPQAAIIQLATQARTRLTDGLAQTLTSLAAV